MLGAIWAGLGRFKGIVAVLLVGSMIVIYTFNTVIDKLAPLLGPQVEVQASEKRTKDYVDQRVLAGEKVVDAKHAEVLNAITRLDRNVENLHQLILGLYKERSVSVSMEKAETSN